MIWQIFYGLAVKTEYSFAKVFLKNLFFYIFFLNFGACPEVTVRHHIVTIYRNCLFPYLEEEFRFCCC